MLYSLLNPLLFSLDAETAHNFVLHIAELSPTLGKLTGIDHDSRFSIPVGNIKWTFPVGLAAGLDKNGTALNFFDAQGFGAIECGTVTLKPQEGNPRPRIFRYAEEKSLRNAMGFPNEGMEAIMPRLKKYEGLTPIGINLGKNKETSPEDSIKELCLLFKNIQSLGQYFVINVSSPNTPGLRSLQDKTYLTELFSEMNKVRQGKDLYLKIAPNLSCELVKELTQVALEQNLTGIVATNTSIDPQRGQGGISGSLLKVKSQEIRQMILRENNKLELIAVGGISDPDDLLDLWSEGGKAAQIYTSYVFQGPDVLKKFKHVMEKFIGFQKLTIEDFFKLSHSERKYRIKCFRS